MTQQNFLACEQDSANPIVLSRRLAELARDATRGGYAHTAEYLLQLSLFVLNEEKLFFGDDML